MSMIINEHAQDLLSEYGELFAELMEMEMKLQVIEAELFDLGIIC